MDPHTYNVAQYMREYEVAKEKRICNRKYIHNVWIEWERVSEVYRSIWQVNYTQFEIHPRILYISNPGSVIKLCMQTANVAKVKVCFLFPFTLTAPLSERYAHTHIHNYAHQRWVNEQRFVHSTGFQFSHSISIYTYIMRTMPTKNA